MEISSPDDGSRTVGMRCSYRRTIISTMQAIGKGQGELTGWCDRATWRPLQERALLCSFTTNPARDNMRKEGERRSKGWIGSRL